MPADFKPVDIDAVHSRRSRQASQRGDEPVRRLWLYVDGKPSMSTYNTPHHVRDIHERVIPSWRQDFPDAKFEVIETIEIPLARLEALEEQVRKARRLIDGVMGDTDPDDDDDPLLRAHQLLIETVLDLAAFGPLRRPQEDTNA